MQDIFFHSFVSGYDTYFNFERGDALITKKLTFKTFKNLYDFTVHVYTNTSVTKLSWLLHTYSHPHCVLIIWVFLVIPVLAPALCPYYLSVSRYTCTRTSTQKYNINTPISHKRKADRPILRVLYGIQLLISKILVYYTFCSSKKLFFSQI